MDKMNLNLIDSINSEVEEIEQLYENCVAVPFDIKLICESADVYIGHAIAALKAGKNPFETIPGSKEIIAGLLLLAKDTNREALNLNKKKFDLISQLFTKKDALKKYVADVAKKHGQSLLKNLDLYVSEKDKRQILTKKLVQLQNAYSQVKHKANQGQEVKKRIPI